MSNLEMSKLLLAVNAMLAHNIVQTHNLKWTYSYKAKQLACYFIKKIKRLGIISRI